MKGLEWRQGMLEDMKVKRQVRTDERNAKEMVRTG